MSDERKIVLASTSPRRKELLALTGLHFSVDQSDYEETLAPNVEPRQLARRLSLEKAKAVAEKYSDALIIAADTFIVCRHSLLGKPHTSVEAARMLTLLSGRRHSVITGFTIIDTATGKRVSRSVLTKVWFRKLTKKETMSYVRTGEPLDKAGAYAIQGLGSMLVERIDGDYFNVIGLPLSSLAEALKKFGVYVL
ncbi:Maf-like protein Mbar_A1652 [Candidatus Sulfobium mesophilum]|uniref:dTTP/UTP pyrophosphatase n=1 Tax=Candidatus Sulfobium mesophilum TaxID=2016548 RepID=A0A2U3QG00_9BACT|nr:Maf-like protein Mbar_A1652 [Candidatus Sulfobium mesophilum]